MSETPREKEGDCDGMLRTAPVRMHFSFRVSVHHSGKEDGFMAFEIHPWQKGLCSEYKYICMCAGVWVRACAWAHPMAGATLDKPTAVNYESARRVGDRLVNMQS